MNEFTFYKTAVFSFYKCLIDLNQEKHEKINYIHSVFSLQHYKLYLCNVLRKDND